MLVVFESVSTRENVFEPPLPAMAAFVSGKSIGESLIGCLLKIEIKGSLNTKTGLVNLLCSKFFFEFATNFFLKPGSDGHLRLIDVQAEGRLSSLISLLMRYGAVGFHLTNHEIAAA